MVQFFKAQNVQMAFEYLLGFIRDPNRSTCAIQPTFSDYSECKRPTLLFKAPFGQNSFAIYASTQFVDSESFFGSTKTFERFGFYNQKTDKVYNVCKTELLRIVGSYSDEDYQSYGHDILGGYIELPGEEDGPVHDAVKDKVAAMAFAEVPYNADTIAKARSAIEGDKAENKSAKHLGKLQFEKGKEIVLSAKTLFPFPLDLSKGYKTDVLFDNLLSGKAGIDMLAADTYRANKKYVLERLYFCYVAKAEFEKVEKEPGWHHAFRALHKGILENADDAKTLCVEVDNGENSGVVHMQKNAMMDNEFWGIYVSTPAERAILDGMFHHGDFTIQNIVKVTYGRKVVYDRATVQNLPKAL